MLQSSQQSAFWPSFISSSNWQFGFTITSVNMRNEPVRHTCPDIDKILKYLKQARQSIGYAIDRLDDIDGQVDGKTGDIEDLASKAKAALNDAVAEIYFSDILEELRDSNSALRDWGHELLKELERVESEAYA